MQPRLHPRSRETIRPLRHRETGHPCRSTFHVPRGSGSRYCPIRQNISSSRSIRFAFPTNRTNHVFIAVKSLYSIEHDQPSKTRRLLEPYRMAAPTFFHRCDSTDFLKTRSIESEDVCLSHGYRRTHGTRPLRQWYLFSTSSAYANRRNHACGC